MLLLGHFGCSTATAAPLKRPFCPRSGVGRAWIAASGGLGLLHGDCCTPRATVLPLKRDWWCPMSCPQDPVGPQNTPRSPASAQPAVRDAFAGGRAAREPG